MKITSHSRIHASVFIALSCLLANATVAWSDTHDPTTPSSQIADRLASDNDVSHLKPTKDAVTTDDRHFRLKAIVLRDSDNGTALISAGDSEVYVVKLRRANLQSSTNRVSIRGTNFSVKDFSESCVIMQSLDTDRQLVIN
jgi:hypothetical protein